MNIRNVIYANAVLFTALLQFSNTVNAGQDQRRGPPPEAIKACASLTAGDSCSFSGRDDEQLTGTCFAPEDRDLACKPEGHDNRRGGGGDSQNES